MKFEFEFEKEKIILEPLITINGDSRKFKFFLDTGASTTLIDKSVAAVLKLECCSSDNLITASGRTKSQTALIPQMELLGKEVSGFKVNLIDFPFQITVFADGLLGMDFLRLFKHLNIDFENKIIEAD